MKNFLIFCLLLPLIATAKPIDVDTAAGITASQQQNIAESKAAALYALISKRSGVEPQALVNKVAINAFKPLILRHYFEKTPEDGEFRYWLRVVVNEQQFKQQMMAQGLPLWPERRKPLFVWAVSEDENGLLNHDTADSELHYWLSKWLENKGVPADFYQPQADDLLDFSAEDVKNLSPDLIDYLQKVQGQGNLLLVYLKNYGDGYAARFGLIEEAKNEADNRDTPLIQTKHQRFVSLPKGIELLSHFVQQQMVAGQQVFANELLDQTLAVSVGNIQNADQLLSTLNYFDNQPLINNYQVTALQQGNLEIRMEVSVITETLLRFIENDNLLTHLPEHSDRKLSFLFKQ